MNTLSRRSTGPMPSTSPFRETVLIDYIYPEYGDDVPVQSSSYGPLISVHNQPPPPLQPLTAQALSVGCTPHATVPVCTAPGHSSSTSAKHHQASQLHETTCAAVHAHPANDRRVWLIQASLPNAREEDTLRWVRDEEQHVTRFLRFLFIR